MSMEPRSTPSEEFQFCGFLVQFLFNCRSYVSARLTTGAVDPKLGPLYRSEVEIF